MCGEANVQELELGMPIRNDNDGLVQYTLAPVYRLLVETFDVDEKQQGNIFTLDYSSQLVARAQGTGWDCKRPVPFNPTMKRLCVQWSVDRVDTSNCNNKWHGQYLVATSCNEVWIVSLMHVWHPKS